MFRHIFVPRMSAFRVRTGAVAAVMALGLVACGEAPDVRANRECADRGGVKEAKLTPGWSTVICWDGTAVRFH